jgi:ribosomal subunit interface protein
MLIASFLDYLRFERNYSSNTIQAYKKDLSQFEEFVQGEAGDEYFPHKVDSDIVRNWIVYLLDTKNSPVTVNRKLSSLKSFFKFLIRQQEIAVSPMKLIRAPKVKRPLPTFVREEDMVSLLDGDNFEDGFVGIRNRLMLETLYDTGVRRSELIGIKNSDVDFERSLLKVTGKRNKQRLIPFAERLSDLLRTYIECRDREVGLLSDWLFVKENGGQLPVSVVYNVVKKALSSNPTLAKRSPHVLRHSFATSMLNHGAELNATKELLGHSSLASTSVYTHTTFEELKKVYHAHPRAFKKEVIMEMRIQSIHFDASEQLGAFVQKKVSKLEQYYDGILLTEVIMKVIKPEVTLNKNVLVKVKVKNGELLAEKTANSFEEAVDECVDALSKQLVKHKEKAKAK